MTLTLDLDYDGDPISDVTLKVVDQDEREHSTTFTFMICSACCKAGGIELSISGIPMCRTPVTRTFGSYDNIGDGGNAYDDRCLEVSHEFTHGKLCDDDKARTWKVGEKICKFGGDAAAVNSPYDFKLNVNARCAAGYHGTKYPCMDLEVGAGIRDTPTNSGVHASCTIEQRKAHILHTTCKAMLGDEWMAWQESKTAWTFYTKTRINTASFDGCGTSAAHDWSQSYWEDGSPNGWCGGYYTQYAFVEEVGCMLIKDNPTR